MSGTAGDGSIALRATVAARESRGRFADGARYRVEIPSVENPALFDAVMDEADSRGVVVSRVSQGSGVMMLTDREISAMAEAGAERQVEVCLFFGPRGEWDTGGQSFTAASLAGAVRGADGVAACEAEARRACALGIRSFLIADVGVLFRMGGLIRDGHLPPDLILKTSVMLPCTNPFAAELFESIGAGTINVATDLSAQELAEIRERCALPLDVYIESPSEQGGFVRFYDIPNVVRAAAPVYLKFGVRNGPIIYPMSAHLAQVAEEMVREEVRRAELGLRLLHELAPDLTAGTEAGSEPGGVVRPDLGIPVPC